MSTLKRTREYVEECDVIPPKRRRPAAVDTSDDAFIGTPVKQGSSEDRMTSPLAILMLRSKFSVDSIHFRDQLIDGPMSPSPAISKSNSRIQTSSPQTPSQFISPNTKSSPDSPNTPSTLAAVEALAEIKNLVNSMRAASREDDPSSCESSPISIGSNSSPGSDDMRYDTWESLTSEEIIVNDQQQRTKKQHNKHKSSTKRPARRSRKSSRPLVAAQKKARSKKRGATTKSTVNNISSTISSRGKRQQKRKKGSKDFGERERYQCKQCGKAFLGESSLHAHMRTHTGERPFICEHCGKGFKQKNNLVVHSRLHTGEKPYPCPMCDKRFPSGAHLRYHTQKHLSEQKKPKQRACKTKRAFECPVCGKGFTQKGNLTRHQRLHTGEKPFSCIKCGACFVSGAHLRYHMQKHSNLADEQKPYLCQHCGKRFTNRTGLKGHYFHIHGLRTNPSKKEPLVCKICQKEFVYRRSFNSHIKQHQKELGIDSDDEEVGIDDVNAWNLRDTQVEPKEELNRELKEDKKTNPIDRRCSIEPSAMHNTKTLKLESSSVIGSDRASAVLPSEPLTRNKINTIIDAYPADAAANTNVNVAGLTPAPSLSTKRHIKQLINLSSRVGTDSSCTSSLSPSSHIQAEFITPTFSASKQGNLPSSPSQVNLPTAITSSAIQEAHHKVVTSFFNTGNSKCSQIKMKSRSDSSSIVHVSVELPSHPSPPPLNPMKSFLNKEVTSPNMPALVHLSPSSDSCSSLEDPDTNGIAPISI